MVALILLGLTIALALVFWIIGIRNRLNELRVQVQHLWSDVDLQLQRRDDTLYALLTENDSPQLSNVKEACQNAVLMRQEVWQSGGPVRASLHSLIQAEQKITALAETYAVVDKLDPVHRELQSTIDAYNTVVKRYNSRMQRPPSAWFVRIDHHKTASLFELPVTMPVSTPV